MNRVVVRWTVRAAAIAAAVLVLVAAPATAVVKSNEGKTGDSSGHLASGTWELGVNASFVSRSGATNADVAVFTNRYWAIRDIPVSAGARFGYGRVSDLDRIDVEASVAAYRNLPGSTAFVYAGIAGGIRQEWVGSFAQARFPLGVDAGLKALASRHAAVSVAYQYRRLLDDPVADFDEHRIVAGISILFGTGGD